MSALSDFARALLPLQAKLPEGLQASNGAQPTRRFAVHRNNVMSSLVRALEDGFPVTAALVGESFFRAMAAEYVRVSPPRSPVLLDHGVGFAQFIADFEPAARVTYLADMARLERARVEAFHAADAQALSRSDFEPWLAEPEALTDRRFALHPSLRLLARSRCVLDLWQAHDDGGETELATARNRAEGTAREDLVVVRPDLRVSAHVLPAGGASALQSLGRGETLGAALESAAVNPGFSLQAVLPLLVDAGLVCPE